jgi:hypothetical protein
MLLETSDALQDNMARKTIMAYARLECCCMLRKKRDYLLAFLASGFLLFFGLLLLLVRLGSTHHYRQVQVPVLYSLKTNTDNKCSPIVPCSSLCGLVVCLEHLQ